eukprot:GFYU01007863.1.p1 GENE.GFYU01007863.1~~GFYU01007863.1.p1  ORF type:complete len:1142 (-),score=294.28 GFYU01007863.1:135-3560(-)
MYTHDPKTRRYGLSGRRATSFNAIPTNPSLGTSGRAVSSSFQMRPSAGSSSDLLKGSQPALGGTPALKAPSRRLNRSQSSSALTLNQYYLPSSKVRRQSSIIPMSDQVNIWSFGFNGFGQLGQGDTDNRSHPMRLERIIEEKYTFQHAIEMSANHFHTAIINDQGVLFTFGRAKEGQLGHLVEDPVKSVDGSGDKTYLEAVSTPKPVTALMGMNVVHVACGAYFTVALADTGYLFAWGENTMGQLGIGGGSSDSGANGGGGTSGNEDIVWVPRKVRLEKPLMIASLVCGFEHTLALTVDGRVYSWGSNQKHQLGHDAATATNATTPTLIHSLSSRQIVVKAVSAGAYHNAVLDEGGAVYTWGVAQDGRLGHGDGNDEVYPRKVERLANIVVQSVHCGAASCMAITEDGIVYTWGSGNYGALGHGNPLEDVSVPRVVEALQGVKVIDGRCAVDHMVALTSIHEVYVWGRSYHGRLGVESEDLHVPTLLDAMNGYGVNRVCCGGHHTLVAVTPPKDKNLKSSRTSPPQCIAYGAGLERAVAGDVAEFTIEARDENGERRPVGYDEFRVWLECKAVDGGVTRVIADVKDNYNGTYEVTYVAKVSRVYHVHATLHDTPIKDMPSQITVVPGPVYPPKCIAKGQHLQHATAGNDYSFVVLGVDQCGNEVITGGGDWKLTCEAVTPISVFFVDSGPGVERAHYKCSYSAIRKGAHPFYIRCDGKLIKGCPYELNIVPGPTSPPHCSALGQGLEKGYVNVKGIFTVIARDVCSNERDVTDDHLDVRFRMANSEGVGHVVPSIGAQYIVSYVPEEMGLCTITVNINGKAINGSPFEVLIKGGLIDASHSELELLDHHQPVAGEPMLLQVVAKDVNGKLVPKAENSLGLVSRPAGVDLDGREKCDAEMENLQDGRHSIRFVGERPGRYLVHATIDKLDIEGSPVELTVYHPSSWVFQSTGVLEPDQVMEEEFYAVFVVNEFTLLQTFRSNRGHPDAFTVVFDSEQDGRLRELLTLASNALEVFSASGVELRMAVFMLTQIIGNAFGGTYASSYTINDTLESLNMSGPRIVLVGDILQAGHALRCMLLKYLCDRLHIRCRLTRDRGQEGGEGGDDGINATIVDDAHVEFQPMVSANALGAFPLPAGEPQNP